MDFDSIPEGSPERIAFEKDFMEDIANSLGMKLADIEMGPITAGSVVVQFNLHAAEGGPSPADLAKNLLDQINDPNSPLRANGKMTSKTDPVASAAAMPSPVEEEEEEEEDEDLGLVAESGPAASLGNRAPTKVQESNVNIKELMELREKVQRAGYAWGGQRAGRQLWSRCAHR